MLYVNSDALKMHVSYLTEQNITYLDAQNIAKRELNAQKKRDNRYYHLYLKTLKKIIIGAIRCNIRLY